MNRVKTKDEIVGWLLATLFLIWVAFVSEILSSAILVSLGALALAFFVTLYVKRDFGTPSIEIAIKKAAIAGWVALLVTALFGVAMVTNLAGL